MSNLLAFISANAHIRLPSQTFCPGRVRVSNVTTPNSCVHRCSSVLPMVSRLPVAQAKHFVIILDSSLYPLSPSPSLPEISVALASEHTQNPIISPTASAIALVCVTFTFHPDCFSQRRAVLHFILYVRIKGGDGRRVT